MLNLILMITPLISVIFTTIYYYNSAEFIELLLGQPLQRSSIWLGVYLGLAVSLGLAFVLGAGIMILLSSPNLSGFLLFSCGLLLTFVFSSIAALAVVFTRDKARGMGISILLWLYFAILFDGLVLFSLFQLSDYPIEHPMVVVSMFNPIDLSRILLLMHLDESALMGYTGAIFKDFFGTSVGVGVSFCVLLLWVYVPLVFSLHRFRKKDI